MQIPITELDGDHCLDAVTWINRKTGAAKCKPIRNVFVMIGAEPNSGWLYGTVKLDNKGFIVTGGQDGFETTPYATSLKGIYAVGDVRSRSLKRVASAVGEGSVVISDVHHYLADQHHGVSPQSDSSLAELRNTSESSDR
jgi:thioredoxin reductase (NADPH)